MEENLKPEVRPQAWIEIDLDAVVENYRQVIAYAEAACRSPRRPPRCMAVVKADGYGLGAEAVARSLARAGCDAFAVTTVEQGLHLRRAGLEGLILVLGPSGEESWPAAQAAGLALSISGSRQLQALEAFEADRQRPPLALHLEIETGMGRTGFTLAELQVALPTLSTLQHAAVEGVYTHFARAAQNDRAYTAAQYARFREAVACLEGAGLKPALQHVCNSAAFLAHPDYHLDMVRIGTLLVGHVPAPRFAGYLRLADPWTAKARVLSLKRVPAGTRVGYQSTYRTRNSTQLAVIGLGYADGFMAGPRLTPQGWIDLAKITVKNLCALLRIPIATGEKITLHGQPVLIAGKVGMELTVLDVRDLECEIGQEVVVPLRRTGAAAHLARFYREQGQWTCRRQAGARREEIEFL